MAYYNRDLKKIDQSNFKYLDKGKCAYVDYNHNIIFKHYFPDMELELRLKACVFDIIKDINNPHFIELIDIYRLDTFLKVIFHKISRKEFIVDAYSAKYYEKENINVLKEPKDYLLDNIRELEILLAIFSDNAILVDDLNSKNVLFTSQRMIIIDPDYFKIYKEKDLVIRNNNELIALIKYILWGNILQLEAKYTYEEVYNMKRKVANFKVDEKTEIAYEFSKKLVGVKKPIEYLLK